MAFTFAQGKNLLLGSAQAIKELAKKDEAKVLVISDSHGSSENFLSALLEQGPSCDALVFCGDGIRDLAACLGYIPLDSKVREAMPAVIAMVQGNNDCSVYPFRNPDYSKEKKNDYFIELKIPLQNTLCICGHKVFVTHGHRYSLYRGLEELGNAAVKEKASIVLYGHTHVALSCWYANTLLLNPGSIARPRGGQKKTYALLTLRKDADFADFTFFSLGYPKSSPYVPKLEF